MPEPVHDISAPVMVTGATGYVAGWLVRRLLEEGYTVHAAVREPDNAAKVGHLTRLAEDLPGAIRLFRADLLAEGSYDAAMEGCRVVFHTASPFTLKISDPQRDLVDPALKGTRNVLGSANRSESVERVVLTSSCAAIYGDAADVAQAPGGVLTEAVWNTTSSLEHQPYSYSKTVAERAAWEMAGAQERWRLVVVNPSFVIGPGLSPAPTSESFALIRQFGDGTMKMGCPPMEIGAVDVRDVAEAHMRAAFIPEAEGRHITSCRTVSFLEIGQILRERFGEDWPFPRRELPKWLLWLVGPLANRTVTRRMVVRNMGHPWKADNSKSKRALGLEYRPIEDALAEMFQQLIDTGQLRPPAGRRG